MSQERDSQTMGYFNLITGGKAVKDRDPKIDPVKGDKVVKGKLSREVMDVQSGVHVYYRKRPNGPTSSCWITTWQDWCRKGDVVARGEP